MKRPFNPALTGPETCARVTSHHASATHMIILANHNDPGERDLQTRHAVSFLLQFAVKNLCAPMLPVQNSLVIIHPRRQLSFQRNDLLVCCGEMSPKSCRFVSCNWNQTLPSDLSLKWTIKRLPLVSPHPPQLPPAPPSSLICTCCFTAAASQPVSQSRSSFPTAQDEQRDQR